MKRKTLGLYILFIVYLINHVQPQTTDGCSTCIKNNNVICYNGDTQVCCTSTQTCALPKYSSFCSNLAQTTSMKYQFCSFDTSKCFTSDPILKPLFGVK